MEGHNDFFNQVYEVVKLIPKGRAASYGAIAAYLGTKRGARLVGWAMNASHAMPDVPAHRVVNRLGVLTGKMHFSTLTEMQEKLAAEGVTVIDDRIQNWDTIIWDPTTELL